MKAPLYRTSLTFEARQGSARWLDYHTHTLDEAHQIWALIRAAADTTGEWVWGTITAHGEQVERLDTIEAAVG